MASEHLSKQHWRKSSQWASLLRPHAQLAVEDTEVEPRFQASCFTYLPNITMALPPHVQVRPASMACWAFLQRPLLQEKARLAAGNPLVGGPPPLSLLPKCCIRAVPSRRTSGQQLKL